jgi:Co/Zn/Cd efflux system component
MGGIGFLALAANLASVLLLLRYKDGDANVRSVWLCSRNDAIGNVALMLAAAGVWGTGAAWPDLVVAAIMAGLFLFSSLQIIRQSRAEFRAGATVKTLRAGGPQYNLCTEEPWLFLPPVACRHGGELGYAGTAPT